MKPVYLLLGPETGEKSQFIKTLKEACRSEFGEYPDIHRFYPFETEESEILAVLRNHSLFTPYQFVVLSQIESLSAAQTTTIAAYLEHPSTTSTLLLISQETKIPRKLEQIVPESERKIFWELFEDRKRDWLVSYFNRQKLDIADDAVELILELVENNTYDLRTACSQLASFFLGLEGAGEPRSPRDYREITEAEVEQYIYHSRKENVFTLFACFASGNLRRSLEIYRTLFFAGEADPVPLLAGLVWQFRRLYAFTELLEEGKSEPEAFRKAAVLGKPAAVTGKRNQQIYREAAQRYSLREQGLVIAALGEYECALREYGGTLEQALMELFIYEVIVNKGRKPASAVITASYRPLRGLGDASSFRSYPRR